MRCCPRRQVKPLPDAFEAAGIRYTLKAYDTTDPSSDDVEAGYKTYKENGCKAIVAPGGGNYQYCPSGFPRRAHSDSRKAENLAQEQ